MTMIQMWYLSVRLSPLRNTFYGEMIKASGCLDLFQSLGSELITPRLCMFILPKCGVGRLNL